MRKLTSIIRSISEPFLNQQPRQLVQFREMITRVSNLVRFISQPSNIFQNLVEIDLFLGFRVRVVVTKVTMSLMIFRVTEIDRNRFRMTNLNIPTSKKKHISFSEFFEEREEKGENCTCRNPLGSGGNRVNTFPPVAERCSSIRAGIGCSFPPGLCKRDNQPVENMSSGEEASTATGVAFEVDATGFDFASYNHSDSLVSSRHDEKSERGRSHTFFRAACFSFSFFCASSLLPNLSWYTFSTVAFNSSGATHLNPSLLFI